MDEDDIIAEMRAIRQQVWDECGQDFRVLVARIRMAQERHPERIINGKQLRQLMQAREAAGVPRLPKEPPYIDPIVEEVHRIREEIAEERARRATQE